MTDNGHLELRRFAVVEHIPGRGHSAGALLQIEGTDHTGRRHSGVGEAPASSAAPYGAIRRWAAELVGYQLALSTPGSAVEVVQTMLDAGASKNETDYNFGITGRSARFGAETALLDLASKALGLTMAQLLGAKEPAYRVAPRSRRVTNFRPSATRRLLRLSLTGDLKDDLQHLLRIATAAPNCPVWWLETRGKYSTNQARSLVSELVPAMGDCFPSEIILEQPVHQNEGKSLGQLQQHADRLINRVRNRHIDLAVMAGDGMTTIEVYQQVIAGGACRAINLNPARIGGLIRTQELVTNALALEPRLRVVISGTPNATSAAIQSLHHLAASIPQVEYITRRATVAPAQQEIAGLGTGAPFGEAFASVRDYVQIPQGEPPLFKSQAALNYPEEEATRYLTKSAMRSHLVEREALIHGLSTVRYNPTAFMARSETGESLLFGASARSPASSAPSFTISDKHKGAAQALLERAGIAVPKGRVFRSEDVESAVLYAEEVGYPLVSKPAGGTGGAAVTVNIRNAEELRAGFEQVRNSTRYVQDDVIVQEQVPGDVYRIMVSDGSVIAVVRRIAPFVTGDGRRCIAELVVQKNVWRIANPRLRKGLIDYDRTMTQLAASNLDLDFVPAADETVVLASDAYLNGGGESIDVLDETHQSILDEAVRAVQVVPGLNYCGVDILLEDHRADISAQRAGVCELNSCPELITPQFPLYGAPRYIARELLRLSARTHGIELASERREDLSLKVRVEASGLPDTYIDWVESRAQELMVNGWVARESDNWIVIGVSGHTVPVSVLVSTVCRPARGPAPSYVQATPHGPVQADKFRQLLTVPGDRVEAI